MDDIDFKHKVAAFSPEKRDRFERRLKLLEESKNDHLISKVNYNNALLTINGLFLAFFAIISSNLFMSKFEVIIFGIFNITPILAIMTLLWIYKYETKIKWENSSILLIKMTHPIAYDKYFKNEETKNNRMSINYKLVNFIEYTSLVCTVINAFFIFVWAIRKIGIQTPC